MIWSATLVMSTLMGMCYLPSSFVGVGVGVGVDGCWWVLVGVGVGVIILGCRGLARLHCIGHTHSSYDLGEDTPPCTALSPAHSCSGPAPARAAISPPLRYGWKQVHGDVFRAPAYNLLFSTLVGTGYQVTVVSFIVIMFSIMGDLYVGRGSIVTTVIFVYAGCAPISGFFGGGLYARNNGDEWIKQVHPPRHLPSCLARFCACVLRPSTGSCSLSPSLPAVFAALVDHSSDCFRRL